MESLVVCDTNILIAAYKNDENVVRQLRLIKQTNMAVSAVTASELIYGARDKQDLKRILEDIHHTHLFQIDRSISKVHLALMRRYALSHKLSLADAMIAATALVNKLPIYTLNLKDFRYIEGLVLYQPV